MFLTLLDDNCVHVYDSPDAAVVAIEALDVDLVRAALFDQGTLAPLSESSDPRTLTEDPCLVDFCPGPVNG